VQYVQDYDGFYPFFSTSKMAGYVTTPEQRALGASADRCKVVAPDSSVCEKLAGVRLPQSRRLPDRWDAMSPTVTTTIT
jgi:hypothetical protein